MWEIGKGMYKYFDTVKLYKGISKGKKVKVEAIVTIRKKDKRTIKQLEKMGFKIKGDE